MNTTHQLSDGSGYRASRSESDRRRLDGITHADSRRLSNSADHPRSPSNNGIIQVGNDGLEVSLVLDYSDDAFLQVSWYSQNASTGAGTDVIGKKRFDDQAFLRGGLAYQSAEDLKIAFAVRGASRVLTHQLVRTRKAGFKQQSQRDCDYGDMPEFRMPESVWRNNELRWRWIAALREAHQAYLFAVRQDIPYEDARHILPEGTTNFILCEYDLRVFMETYAYRGCVMFQSEMVAVMRAMRRALIEAHPYLEQHLKISCERVHRCTFQGEEPTVPTCDLPWARATTKTLSIQESR